MSEDGTSTGASSRTGTSSRTGRRLTGEEMDALGDEIAQLAGQIAAATARFLHLLGEFDAVGGWGGVGIRSLPHWLSWRAGMSLRTARDHVRVARALRELPVTAAAFRRGELSFSKVRALTRVATTATEDELVTLATHCPASHVERLVAGLRKVARPVPEAMTGGDEASTGADEAGSGADEAGSGADEPSSAEPGRLRRPRPPGTPPQRLQWRWDEETDELVVWGRFGAADGKTLLAALTRAELERVRTLAHDRVPTADGTRADETHVDETTSDGAAVDRTAPPPLEAGPALLALAQIGLTTQKAPSHAPAAEVIFLHTTQAEGDGSAEPHAHASGVVSADEGPALDEHTGAEVLCDAATRCVAQGSDGAVLAYGRRRRGFSAAQLRALHLRDRCCRTPGCQRTRFLHAHHVVWWSRRGRTDLDNAVLLCSACHRAVHLGRLLVRATGDQRYEFVDARSGTVLVDAPPMFGLADELLGDRTILPRTITGGWWGEPLDLSDATASLIAHWRARGAWPEPPDAPARAWDDPPAPRWTTQSAA